MSTTTTATKYQSILTPLVNKASAMIDAQPKNTTPTGNNNNNNNNNTNTSRPNAWQRQHNIPLSIDFSSDSVESDDSDFPPLTPPGGTRLSSYRTAATQSQASDDPTSHTTITMSTIQSAIADAISKVQQDHKTEIDHLRAELHAMNATLHTLVQTIAAQSEHLLQQVTHQQKDPKPLSPPRKRSNTARTPTKSNRTKGSKTLLASEDQEDTNSEPDQDDSDLHPKWADMDTSSSDDDVPSTQPDENRRVGANIK